MVERPAARHAYVKAEVATALAHQIRALRLQRGWSQRQLAEKLGTTQAAVSRLEDPSYGKLTLQTLMALSGVFDTGLSVQFVSLIDMVRSTFIPNAAARLVEPFELESQDLGYVCDSPVSAITVGVESAPALPGASERTMLSSFWVQPMRMELVEGQPPSGIKVVL